MKDFIEKALHCEIVLSPYDNTENFPLMLRHGYEYYLMEVLGQHCIVAMPECHMRPALLRSHQKMIERATGMLCVLYLIKLDYYTREKLLEEGIPFIWENHQIYIPFFGLLLTQNEARAIQPCSRISFLTQKFLLLALYGDWDSLTATVAAKLLNVTKMSMTRVFDELESLGIPVLAKKGRSRVYSKIGKRKKIWEAIKPFLRNPLIKAYYLQRDRSDISMRSGISGLAEMSMLKDDSYPTYAIAKTDIKAKGINLEPQVPLGEMPGCVIHELGYCIPFNQGTTVDPLTIYLLLEHTDDPRIEKALDEMLKNCVLIDSKNM